MGDGQSDIGNSSAALPSQFTLRLKASGWLTSSFYTVVDALASTTRVNAGGLNPLTSERARETAGQALAENSGATSGFMLTGAQATIQANADLTDKEKREKEQRAFDQIMDAITKRLGEINAEIANIDKRLEEIRVRRLVIGDRLDAMDDLAELMAHGQLDPNNPAHAELLRRAGYSADDAKHKDFSGRFAKDRRDLMDENTLLDGEQHRLVKRREEVLRDKQDVENARAEIENADTNEARAAAILRAQTLIGKQELAAAAYASTDKAAQTVAAQTVAATDKQEYQAASKSESEIATKDIDKYYTGADDMNWGTSTGVKLPPM